MTKLPEININVDSNGGSKKPEAYWQWVLKHVIVPLVTAIIGAMSAGYIVRIQADADMKHERMDSTVKSAASDAVLRNVRERLDAPMFIDAPPSMDPMSDENSTGLNIPDEPPGDVEMSDYIDNAAQMQQLQANPDMLDAANAAFRKEWKRVAGELKGGKRRGELGGDGLATSPSE